jgi:DNA-binding transcriptional LysR family regulator
MAQSANLWHGVELRHFAALEAIARERSFSGAAQSLGYTQSTISGQIAQLERVIGTSLFRRLPGPRGVELTSEGTILLAHARAISDRLQAARADVEAARLGGGPRVVTVGTFPSLSTTFMPDVLAKLAREPAPVRVELREDSCGSSVLRSIERGELDAAFTTLPLHDGPFHALELFHDPYCLAVSPGHALGSEPTPVPLGRLAELPIIAQPRAGKQQLIEESLNVLNTHLNVVARADTWASIYAHVEAGDGFGLVPSLALVMAPARLRILMLDPRIPTRRVAIVWHTDRLCTAGLEQLIQASSESAEDFCPRSLVKNADGRVVTADSLAVWKPKVPPSARSVSRARLGGPLAPF